LEKNFFFRYVNTEHELYDKLNDETLKELQQTLKMAEETPISKSRVERSPNNELPPNSDYIPVVPLTAPATTNEYPLITVCKALNDYILTQHIALYSRLNNHSFINSEESHTSSAPASDSTLTSPSFRLTGVIDHNKSEEQIQMLHQQHYEYVKTAIQVCLKYLCLYSFFFFSLLLQCFQAFPTQL
jgi:hypothetical protein